MLGFIVSERGIEVNREKIKAILDITRPTRLKDVQCLTGCIVVVSRFISWLGEKAGPLYKLLKKTDQFVWTDESEATVQEFKRILSSARILAAPTAQEPMLLYIAVTNRVVSVVTTVERGEAGATGSMSDLLP